MDALTIYNDMADSHGQAEALLCLARAYTAQGKLATARKVAEQSKELSTDCGNVTAAARADTAVAQILLESGDGDAAVGMLLKVKEVFACTCMIAGVKVFLSPRELGNTLCSLGEVYRKMGQRDLALGSFQQAGIIFAASEDGHGVAKQLCMSALVFATKTANGHACAAEEMAQALVKLKGSNEQRQEHGNRLGVAECIRNQGVLLMHQGNSHKGNRKLMLAFDMYKELMDKRGQAHVLLEMGHGCFNSEKGIVHYEQSLTILREIGDLASEADCLEHLGALRAYLGRTYASVKCWLDALNLRRELGHAKGIKLCLEQICVM